MSMDFRPLNNLQMNPGGMTGIATDGNERNLLVMFYNRAVEIPSESLRLGRRFTKDVIHVKIQHPGEAYNIIDRPVTDQDKHRFRLQWSNFIQNRTQIPEGCPIDLLFPNHPSVGENLRAHGVHTIEQCAELSAHAIDNIGRGAQEYKNRANKYLESANKGAAFHSLQAENDKLQQNQKILENQIAQLKAQLDHVLMKFNDPLKASQSPNYIPGYDVQADRINANHPTVEAAKKKTGRRGPKTLEDNITDPLANSNPNLDNNLDISMTEGQDA